MKEDRGTSKAVSKIKGGKEIIDQYGFSLIAETDFMFSLPEWIQTYNNTVFELQMKRNMTAEEIEKELEKMAAMYKMTLDQLREELQKAKMLENYINQIAGSIFMTKVKEFLVKNN